MIEIKNISKSFDENAVLKDISYSVSQGNIWGIVGSNGAGKSTLLRILSGVYDIKYGSVEYDGIKLDNKLNSTPDILFVSDDMYYETNETVSAVAKRFKLHYKNFEKTKYSKLLSMFDLDEKTKMDKLSKGMKKQAFLSIVLACNPKYLFLDETLDGLDPLMRINAKKLIFDETINRKMTTVITSHSLKELEDMCDNLSMLHKGELIISGSIDDFKSSRVKIHCAFNEPMSKEDFKDIEIESFESSGKIYTLITKGDKNDTIEKMSKLKPILVETFPVTIEEIFVIKLKELGYGDKIEWRID